MYMVLVIMLALAAPLILTLNSTPSLALNTFEDYANGKATYVSTAVAPGKHDTPVTNGMPLTDTPPKMDDGDTPPALDEMYVALSTGLCGKTRSVIWIRMDGQRFYVTGETRVNGTFPQLAGDYTYDGAAEELTRDGKPCKGVKSEPDEASRPDAAMLEDRFGLPVFQLGPEDRAEWTVCRILLKDKSIGEIVMPAGDQSKAMHEDVSFPQAGRD
jgi:hypothetical protein